MTIFYILLLIIIVVIIFLSFIIKTGFKNIANSINNIKFDYKINNYIEGNNQKTYTKEENNYENKIENAMYEAQSKIFEKPALISKNNVGFITRDDDIEGISRELKRVNNNE